MLVGAGATCSGCAAPRRAWRAAAAAGARQRFRGAGALAIAAGAGRRSSRTGALHLLQHQRPQRVRARRRGSEQRQAEYEKQLQGSTSDLPQPRITAVRADVDIFPESGGCEVRGHYRLRNKTGAADRRRCTSTSTRASRSASSRFRPHRRDADDARARLLDLPRSTRRSRRATTMTLDFDLAVDEPRLRQRRLATPRVVDNGTFFNSRQYFPSLGYDERRRARATATSGASTACRRCSAWPTLDDRVARAQQRPRPRRRLDRLRDHGEHQRRIRSRSRRATCSASGPTDGRRYFHYKMDAPILDFYSLPLGALRGEARPLERRRDRDLLPPGARLQRRPDDRRRQEVARLLHRELRALPAPPGAHPRVPALRDASRSRSRTRSPTPSRIGFIARRARRRRGHRLPVLRHRARGRAPVVGAPGDRRQRAGRDDARRDAGAVLGADGDGEGVRRASRCGGSSSTSSTATCAAAAAS